jgi:glycosyltransferase involved in cell wall biosynthesis
MSHSVDIGIPSYNSAQFIHEAIKGCLDQDYRDLRVIIADDHSTDDTLRIVEKYAHDPRVVITRNEQNIGRIANYRHLLYDLATADWYLNLDGDDYFADKEFISVALNHINTLKENIVFFQGNHDLDQLKKIFPHYTQLSEQEILVDGKDYFMLFHKIRKNFHCATLYNREKAMEVSFYNFDCLYVDFFSIAKLSLLGKVILSSRYVSVWRQHAGNASKSLTIPLLRHEIESLREVSVFARNYMPVAQTEQWLRDMKEYYRLSFIYYNSTHFPRWAMVGFILRNWKFTMPYPRYLLKNIYLIARNAFKPKNKRPNS